MKKPSPRRRLQSTFRPRFEALETRLTPTTYTVSSLADSGEGSLRAAITSANGDSTADTIDFSIAGVIQLTSGALPVVINSVAIDATTAPGWNGSAPLVEIDCHGFAGLTLAGTSGIEGASIVNADGPGVTLTGTRDIVELCYIGLALDGSVAGNSGVGVLVASNSTLATIGSHNVISGNGAGGIQVGSSGAQAIEQDVTIAANFIGTDPTGTLPAPNQGNGITIYSKINVIGNNNTIAFNTQSGIQVNVSPGNQILGNSIFSNGAKGIDLQNGGNDNMPAPQLSYAVESPGSAPGTFQVQVGGVVNIPPGSTINVSSIQFQVYATLDNVPAGQGQIFVGSVFAKVDSNGFASFALRNASVAAGGSITFTATATAILPGSGPFRATGSTSAFSAAIGLGTANQAYVANVYQLLLSRIPDPSSSVWVDMLNSGSSSESIVLGVEGSTEYLNDQVTALYQHYLKRRPDAAGAQHWLSALQAGGTFEQVAAELASSQEYFALHGGTNAGFITGLYADVLNRSPSTDEVASWVFQLNNGASRLGVSLVFLTTAEYQHNLVETYYQTYLLRPPEIDGLQAWVNAMSAGVTDQEVVAGIFGSTEGYQLWS